MSHHLNKQGRFQSDKYKIFRNEKNGEECSEDKFVLSFKDEAAHYALREYASNTKDTELAVDIVKRLMTIKK